MGRALSLRQRNLRIALLKTLLDTVEVALKKERAAHLKALTEEYKASANRVYDVLLPSGEKVGTVGLTGIGEGKFTVEDEAALLDWAKEHSPQSLREVVEPPQPERRWVEWWPASKTALLKRLAVNADGQVVDPTGDPSRPIPGLKYVPPGDPTNFQVRVSDAPALVNAWAAGELAGLTEGTPLPQLGMAPVAAPVTADDFDEL